MNTATIGRRCLKKNPIIIDKHVKFTYLVEQKAVLIYINRESPTVSQLNGVDTHQIASSGDRKRNDLLLVRDYICKPLAQGRIEREFRHKVLSF